jgi:hypothetical protein
VQWIVIVDDLDSGGGQMANKIKVLRLRAMAMCLWVPTFVGSLWGECSHLVPELNYLKKSFLAWRSGI